ncbi:MAG: phosphatidylglycerophosphatase A, partial [Bacteroidales bacterium]|nr:phosphatidylglycerophosphatase A [Bacteroidales bacterium]
AGFLIFRFFDILKPFPIRLIEKKIPGGAGIVLDDVAAGIFSNIVLRISIFIMFGRV